MQIATLLLLVCGEASAQTIITKFVSGPGRDRGEGPAMVCDRNYETKWCVDFPMQMPYTIVLDAGEKTTFAEYSFVTGNDTQDYPERNPVAWRVSGSNDRENWITIDEHKNNRSIPAENEQEYRIKPTAAGASGSYRYFRFEFFRMAGGTRIQLSEINLYKTPQTAVNATFVSGTGQGKEGAAMVADGHLFTKWCIDESRQMPYNVVLDAGEKTAISEYRFVTGDDTYTYPDRNPVTWRVSGSNDMQNWRILDEQKNNRRLRDENEQEYRFKVPAPAPFRYYRFEFIRMTAGTRLQLSEIKLYR